MEKVYLVWSTNDNLQDFEDHDTSECLHAIFDSREKALDYIKAYTPTLHEGQRMIENPSEICTEAGFVATWRSNAERVIYIHSEDKWDRELIEFTIEEREVR